MADKITKKILNADSFKESLRTLTGLSEVCGKLDVSAITVMKRSGYSYCDRIALEIGVPYSTVLPIVWGLWDSEFKRSV